MNGVGFWPYVLMIFVLTPLAALQSAAGGAMYFFATGGGGEDSLIPLIVSIVATLIINRLVHWIRYGWDVDWGVEILDFFIAPLMLPLMLISDVLGFISFFTDWDVDPRDVIDVTNDGLPVYLLSHLLMIKPSGHYGHWTEKVKDPPKENAADYRKQNIIYQLKILLLSLCHSTIYIFLIIGLMIDGGFEPAFNIIVGIFAIIIYIFTACTTANMRNMFTGSSYYDNEQITRITHRWSDWQNDFVEERKVIKEAGWKFTPSIRFILYLLLSYIWWIPQTVAFIISIVTPPYSRIFPCRARDIPRENLGLGNRILLFLFGFIIP